MNSKGSDLVNPEVPIKDQSIEKNLLGDTEKELINNDQTSSEVNLEESQKVCDSHPRSILSYDEILECINKRQESHLSSNSSRDNTSKQVFTVLKEKLQETLTCVHFLKESVTETISYTIASKNPIKKKFQLYDNINYLSSYQECETIVLSSTDDDDDDSSNNSDSSCLDEYCITDEKRPSTTSDGISAKEFDEVQERVYEEKNCRSEPKEDESILNDGNKLDEVVNENNARNDNDYKSERNTNYNDCFNSSQLSTTCIDYKQDSSGMKRSVDTAEGVVKRAKTSEIKEQATPSEDHQNILFFEIYYKVKLSNMHARIDYVEVETLLKGAGLDYIDILLINKKKGSYAEVSFTDPTMMEKALQLDKTLKHAGLSINITPLAKPSTSA